MSVHPKKLFLQRYRKSVNLISKKHSSPLSFECQSCRKVFHSKKVLSHHTKKCGVFKFYPCNFCGKHFSEKHQVKKHSAHCFSKEKKKGKSIQKTCLRTKNFKCSLCESSFSDRKLLYRHKLKHHHQRGGGNEDGSGSQSNLLQSPPWPHNSPVRPWTDSEGKLEDQEFKECYDLHRNIILQNHIGETDSLSRLFNFPISYPEMQFNFKSHLEYIFEKQSATFKLNLSFGFILQNTITGEYRFYIPYKNAFLFDKPKTISNRKDLKRILKKILKQDIEQKALLQRPNTSWKAVMITNVNYTVYSTGFTLGHGVTPKWLSSNKSIVSYFGKISSGDHLCAFRCLAYHNKINKSGKKKKKRNSFVEKEAKKLFSRWCRVYCPEEDSSSFNGLSVPSDIPKFEKLFNVNVNIFQYDPHMKFATPLYLSKAATGKCNKQDLNMNCHENHLSYIANLSLYTKKYKCRFCSRCFRSCKLLTRHEKRKCFLKSKLQFPSGYFVPTVTIFEELKTVVDIDVPGELREYEYFIMYDFEALLLNVSDSDEFSKQVFTHRHHPISVSICSNVPGFTDPKCFVDPCTDSLLRDMIEYMSEISTKSAELIREKLNMYILQLETCIEKYKSELLERTGDGLDECEGTSRAMQDRLSKANVFASMLQSVDEKNIIAPKYNDWVQLDKSDYRCKDTVNATTFLKHLLPKCLTLKKKLESYITQIPVLGFNSAKYDLNLIKPLLAKHLNLTKSTSSPGEFVIKKANQYLCLQTDKFRFLDLVHYLPPATSYDQFLTMFKVSQRKGFFPYEYLTNVSKLCESSLPPIDAFWSSLKDRNTLEDSNYENYQKCCRNYPDLSPSQILQKMNISKIPNSKEENYQYLKHVWEIEEMNSLLDLLVWYNNLDVKPGVEAVVQMQSFYRKMNVDIFKEAMSAPGIARKLLFKDALESKVSFSLFNTENSDLYHTVKRNLIGGPSIIFKRIAEKGKTFIRNNPKKMVQSIEGFDANSLYLYCIDQEMPVSYFIRWLPKGLKDIDEFRSERSEKYTRAFDWLDWVAQERDIIVQHKLNSGREIRVGPYSLDGFALVNSEKTAFEFNGCYFHGHPFCTLGKNSDKQEDRYRRTLGREEYLRRQGYSLCSIWECEFNHMVKTNQSLQQFMNSRGHQFYKKFKSRKVTSHDILQGVTDESFFGMVEVDIKVPSDKYEYFSEMSPFFVTTKVPFSCIGEHMQAHAKSMNLSTAKRTMLVGGMKAKSILLATPLLRWYLCHGIVVTHVHQAVEYERHKCFSRFVTQVTNARRQGDEDPDLEIMGNLQKLIGNSAYGSLIMNKENHQSCQYVQGEVNAKLKINDPTFVGLSELDEQYYEVLMAKKRVKLDLPITIGYYVLQMAKMRLLEFYYDFLDVYLDRSDFELLQIDTDSMYFSLSGSCLLDTVRPEKKVELNKMLMDYCSDVDPMINNQERMIPRACCSIHAKYDKRTPGLFKLEAEGTEMVCLNSKTYVLDTSDRLKISSKGLNKNALKNVKKNFKDVLTDGQSRFGVNKGFQCRKNSVFTYKQVRWGLSYFYCKRKVQSDGVSTIPLKLTLKPLNK